MRQTRSQLALVLLAGLILSGLWWTSQTGRSSAAGGAEEADRSRPDSGPDPAPEPTGLNSESGTNLQREGAGAMRSADADPTGISRLRKARSQAPHAPGVRIFGQVLDASGAPLEDAEVVAYSSHELGGLPLGLGEDFLPADWPKPVRARTDAQGRYECHGLQRERLRVMAHKPGHLRAYLPDRLLPVSSAALELEPLRLGRAVEKSGEVRSSEGLALRGARILRALEGQFPSEPVAIPGAAVEVATTDEAGQFVLREEGPGSWVLWAEAEGHLPQRLAGNDLEHDELHFRLSAGLRLRGQVMASSAQPLPKRARVVARTITGAQGAAGLANMLGRKLLAPLAEQGRFEFEGLQAGLAVELELQMQAASGAWHPVPGATRPVVDSLDEVAIIQLGTPRELIGFVVDETNGQPVEHFQIRLRTPFDDRLLRDDAHQPLSQHPGGGFAFTDLDIASSQPLHLCVHAPGYLDHETEEFLALEQGRTERSQIRLTPAPSMRVRVLAAEDQSPLANALVVACAGEAGLPRSVWQDLRANAGEFLPGISWARTDSHGLALITGSSDASFQLGVRAQGRMPSDPQSCPPLSVGQEREVQVRLALGGRVRVEVRDPFGRPVAGVGVVRLGPETDENLAGQQLRLVCECETDARGEALLSALQPGMHRLRTQETRQIRVSGDSPAGQRDWVSVQVAETGEARVVLTARPRVQLAGRVRQGSKGLSGAQVRLAEVTPENRLDVDDWNTRSVWSDSQGEFRCLNLPVGTYRMTVLHAELATQQVRLITLAEPEERVDIQLDVTALAGRVVDPEGRPLAGVRAFVGLSESIDVSQQMLEARGERAVSVSRNLLSRTAKTDVDGRFEFAGLATEQPILLELEREDGELRYLQLPALRADERRTGLEWTLGKAGSIEVSLLRQSAPSEATESLQARFVRQVAGVEEVCHPVPFDGDRAVAERLGPGEYRVEICNAEGRPLPKIEAARVRLEDGALARVSLTLP